MRTLAPTLLSLFALLTLTACDSDKGPCLEKSDFVACNRSCDGPGTKESCAKRVLIAAEVCAGKTTNPHFKNKQEACEYKPPN